MRGRGSARASTFRHHGRRSDRTLPPVEQPYRRGSDRTTSMRRIRDTAPICIVLGRRLLRLGPGLRRRERPLPLKDGAGLLPNRTDLHPSRHYARDLRRKRTHCLPDHQPDRPGYFPVQITSRVIGQSARERGNCMLARVTFARHKL